MRRSFALLWVSQAASALGTSISSLAYPLLVLDLTGSPVQAGLVGGVQAAAALLLKVPGGILADRRPPRALMIAADAVRAAVVGALAVLVLTGAATLPLILAAVALEVAFGTVFGPAEFSLVRSVVPAGERALAVGRMQSRTQLAGLLGPVVGGALYGLSPALPFAADALSYLVSLALVLGVQPPLRTAPAAGERLAGGWRWLRSDPLLLPAGLWVAGLTAVFGAVGLAILVLARERGATPAELGVLFAISTLGGLVGALLTPAIQRRWRPGTVFRAAAVLDTAATLALLPLVSPYAIGVAGAVAFLLAPAVSASLFGALSERCPDHLVGRAQSTLSLVVGAPAPLAPVAIGAAIAASSAPIAIAACAGAFAVLALAAFALPAFRAPGPASHRG
ncbi:MFS transporter [Naasia sp. SYSU D00057]|uniref:MFS transporter n=1 Tax=Naasia sp. SYSU D00057 TaxID=2817380 RepID=UPI001B30DFE7|nr:MFS transporter [Naasia sp. SYSU D00057]